MCFEFLSVGAWGDCSPYSRDRWAVLPGLSSPLAAHESWLILIKASLTFVSWGCCRWDIVALMQQMQDRPQRTHFRPVFFFFFSLNSIHIIHPPSSQSELLAAWSNIIQNWFYPRPLWQNVLSLQGLLHHSLCFFFFSSLPSNVSTHKHMKRQIQENQ